MIRRSRTGPDREPRHAAEPGAVHDGRGYLPAMCRETTNMGNAIFLDPGEYGLTEEVTCPQCKPLAEKYRPELKGVKDPSVREREREEAREQARFDRAERADQERQERR